MLTFSKSSQQQSDTELTAWDIITVLKDIEGSIKFISELADEARDRPEVVCFCKNLLAKYNSRANNFLVHVNHDSFKFAQFYE